MEEKLIITGANQTPVIMKNFGQIPEEYSNIKRAKVAILQVPYEKTVSYKKGTKNGPAAIIDASTKMELFDDELNQETYRVGIHTMEPLEVRNLPSEAMVDKVYVSTADILKSGKFPIILGGEHSISVGAVKAFREMYQNLSVLQLDAHYDLRDEYQGSKLSHACAARRICEMAPIVQVGTRSLSKEEKDFLAAQSNGKVKTISVYDILEMPLWKDNICNSLSENIYVTIDMDVFDPSLVPAVGTPEPGGIGWYETLDLLRDITKEKKVVGFDIVELCPIEGQVASDFLAAKLIYRFLGYIFPSKK